MPVDPQKIWIYRITHFQNLEYILQNGIYYRNSPRFDPNYVNIGSSEIIDRRDHVDVKCYPELKVNDCVPFYFGVRSPMLLKIKTGNGVTKRPQHEIIYLCCKMSDICDSDMQWCFTDGNATTSITEFYNNLDDLELLDWKSIKATDWSPGNVDGDTDRMRKKQSEFLIREYTPVEYIKRIVVLTEERKKYVETFIKKYGLKIEVFINPQSKFYY